MTEGIDRYCPVHGKRSQDGYSYKSGSEAGNACNATVRHEHGIPILCGKPTTLEWNPKPLAAFDTRLRRRIANARREIEKATKRAKRTQFLPGHYAEAIRLTKEVREEIDKLIKEIERRHDG